MILILILCMVVGFYIGKMLGENDIERTMIKEMLEKYRPIRELK